MEKWTDNHIQNPSEPNLKHDLDKFINLINYMKSNERQ